METRATENYIKAIYAICTESGSETASTSELARNLGLTPGTVTGMLQRLDEAKLVKYRSHQGARLTPAGQQLALKIVRRHRLLELLLTQTLGMPWDEVHAEAEDLEHAVSDRLIERIDEFLGRPEHDPHGDPIPDADGRLRCRPGRHPDAEQSLATCPAGTCFELLRVPDRSAEFLRYIAQGGLHIGSRSEVVENSAAAGVIVVRSGQGQFSLGRQAAEKLFVRRIEPKAS